MAASADVCELQAIRSGSDDALRTETRHVVSAEAEFRENLVGMLAEQRGAVPDFPGRFTSTVPITW